MTVHRMQGSILLLLAFLDCAVAGKELHISEHEARQLVIEALKAERAYSPSVELSPLDYSKEFYCFEANWPNPNGSPHLGAYGVNPWTGDVWLLVVGRRITSPSIRAIQKAIRNRFHYPREEYRKRHSLEP